MRTLIFAALALVASGCCCKAPAGGTSSSSPVGGGPTGVAPGAAKAATPATPVDLKTLLADYKGNEVRADGLYKDKYVKLTGKVGDIKKGLGGGIYVTLGTGAQFEIPTVQCFPDDSHTAKASTLNKGQDLTITGRVQGLMMNVLIQDCSF